MPNIGHLYILFVLNSSGKKWSILLVISKNNYLFHWFSLLFSILFYFCSYNFISSVSLSLICSYLISWVGSLGIGLRPIFFNMKFYAMSFFISTIWTVSQRLWYVFMQINISEDFFTSFKLMSILLRESVLYDFSSFKFVDVCFMAYNLVSLVNFSLCFWEECVFCCCVWCVP